MTCRSLIRTATVTFAMMLLAAHVHALSVPEKDKAKDLDVKQFGAIGDGKTKDTAAIQKAIDQAGQSGGTVRIPAGVFLSAALNLRSNMTLLLEEGATLKAAEAIEDFPPIDSRWEGIERSAYSCLINGRDLENVTITGKGTIDGSGKVWWDRIRGAGGGLPLPRPRLVEFIHSKKVRVEGVTLKDSPAWTLHPLYCEDFTADGLTITAPANSPNTDGINPDSSRNVTITNCTIGVGDDCIAIKSGKDADGRRVGKPVENVTVAHCRMLTGHGGVTIGSETSGGVRNIKVSDCTFEGTERGVRMKTQRGRGGVVEKISFENVTMKNCGDAIHITMFYSGRNDGTPSAINEGTPTMGGITIRDVTATGCKTAGLFEGLPERPLSDVTLINVKIAAQQGFVARDAKGLKFQEVKLDIVQGPSLTKTRVEGEGLPEK